MLANWWRRVKKLPPRVKTGVWVTSLVALVTAAVSGVIGNGAYASFLWLLDQIRGFMQANSPSWVIVYSSWVILLALIAFGVWDRINLRRSVGSLKHAIDHINNLDDTLVNCAPQLLSPKKPDHSLEDEVRFIVGRLLKQATEAFPRDVHRAVFFRPDPARNGKYLELWEECGGIDKNNIKRKNFYIGEERQPGVQRGIAGEAFHKRNIIVAHIKDHNGVWKGKADKDAYICFDEERIEAGQLTYPRPPYTSLACVPLVIHKGGKDCLGVVCFDSNNPYIFDPPQAKALLFLLAARLRAIMVIHREVEIFFLKGQAQGGGSTV